MELQQVEIFSDGSCHGNPGNGGYGTIIRIKDTKENLERLIFPGDLKLHMTSDNILDIHLSEGYRLTTNNRMELMGVIAGFKFMNEHKLQYPVFVISDSQYVCKAFNEGWIKNWVRQNWKNSSGEVKNKDLWKELLEESSPYVVKYHWVKGHADHPENNQCDFMAVNAALKSNLKEDEGYEK